MSDPYGETRLHRLAENANLKTWSRLVMAIGVPIGLAAGGGAATWVVRTTQANTEALLVQGETLKSLTNVQLPAAVDKLNIRLENQTQRIDGLERKNEAQDAAIDDLRRSVYPLIIRK